MGLLLYITSADSGALVMSNFTSRISDSRQDGPVWSRIFWAALVGVLTIVLLQIGGVYTVQAATVVMGLPFAVVMYLIMFSLVRSLRLESFQADARLVSLHGAMSGRSASGSWRRRLQRASTWPSEEKAEAFISQVAEPALKAVAHELESRGLEASLLRSEVPDCPVEQLDLNINMAEEQDFRYQIYPIQHEVPSFTRNTGAGETYYRLEVHDFTGSLGYDVYGYTEEQLIDNVLDLYERHLEFLHMQRDLPGTSDVTDGAEPVRTWIDE